LRYRRRRRRLLATTLPGAVRHRALR